MNKTQQNKFKDTNQEIKQIDNNDYNKNGTVYTKEEISDKDFDSSYLSQVYSSSKNHEEEKSKLMFNVPLVFIIIIFLILLGFFIF